MPAPLRTERTETRLLPEQKRRMERAALLKGISLSEFIVQNADEAAIRTIQQHESWALNDVEREGFMNALLHPGVPNARLRAAAGRYKELVHSGRLREE